MSTLNKLAEYSLEQFEAAFSDMKVDEFIGMVKSETGIDVARQPRKADTIREAHGLIVHVAGKSPSGLVPEVPPEGAGVPLPPPPSGRLFEIRSRQPQGRWRCNKLWPAKFQLIREDALRAEEWAELRADPQIQIREPIAPEGS